MMLMNCDSIEQRPEANKEAFICTIHCQFAKTVGIITLETGKRSLRKKCIMSGHYYAQATSEENTELVTNRANVNPLQWTASYRQQPVFESQNSANLVSNFSDLHLSSHSSSFTAPVPNQQSQFPGSAISVRNVLGEHHQSQNAAVNETRQMAAQDDHLRQDQIICALVL